MLTVHFLVIISFTILVNSRSYTTEFVPSGVLHPLLHDIPQCAVYCSGPILDNIQVAGFFNDSKTFVDMPMKYDPEEIVAKFKEISGNLTREILQQFLADNFLPAGSELETTTLPDWTPNPGFLTTIVDLNYRQFASQLHKMWNYLGKKLAADVFQNPQRYSMVPIARPFVVPGGRFREFYYWDTYWILKALLVGELTETSKGIIMNMIEMVSLYGFVPNGARIYYLTRSQPPLLASMVDLYYRTTKDDELMKYALPYLDKEYQFWMTTHAVTIPITDKITRTVINVTLNHYFTDVKFPRPESYTSDVSNSAGMSPECAEEFYANTAAAAESGWDFSSRWFVEPDNISSIKTKHIIPVDVNAILYKTESILDHYYTYYNMTAPRDYKKAMELRKFALNNLLFNEETFQWHDYDMEKNSLNPSIYPSNFLPLWSGAFDENLTGLPFKETIVQSLLDSGLVRQGGILTSLTPTSQQWDYPNAWSPLQSFLIESMRNLNTTSSLQVAQDLASIWVKSNYIGYQNSGFMNEKYNALIPGAPGNGGEYEAQVGFGWTNGVVIQLLQIYGDVLHP